MPREGALVAAGRQGFAGLLLMFGVWCLGGCSPATRTVIPPNERPFEAMTESREMLLSRLEGLEDGISTLTGTSVTYLARGLGLTSGVLAEYRETEGYLLVERPDEIRMRGSAPLGFGTVFDMVSDRRTFEVWLPTRNEFITGQADSVTCSENPILNLRPQHIMDALFIDISPYLANDNVVDTLEVVPEGRRSFYVLSFIDITQRPPELLEKIWIDRLDLSVARKQLFEAEGIADMNVTYSDWEETDGDLFPRTILVERPVEDYSLEIRFEELRVNDVPNENAFVLVEPPGAKHIEVESNPEECRH